MEQQLPHLDALQIPAAVEAEGSKHKCSEKEHSQSHFLLFPGNKPPFDPSRLHSSQRGVLQRGASRATAEELGGPPPPRFESAGVPRPTTPFRPDSTTLGGWGTTVPPLLARYDSNFCFKLLYRSVSTYVHSRVQDVLHQPNECSTVNLSSVLPLSLIICRFGCACHKFDSIYRKCMQHLYL